jgi:hypothetical protein
MSHINDLAARHGAASVGKYRLAAHGVHPAAHLPRLSTAAAHPEMVQGVADNVC